MAELATEESRFAFDLDGYVVYSNLLPPGTTAAELCDAGSAASAAVQAVIRGHAGGSASLSHRAAYDGGPGLQPAHSIVHVLDREPRWVEPSSSGRWATDSGVDAQLRLGYDCLSRPDRVCCWGVRVVCALESEGVGVLTACPASHKSNVHPPPSTERADALGATERLRLEPGDCAIAAATTLVAGSEGRLLELLFADTGRYPQLGAAAAATPPEWHRELTPRQQAMLAPTYGIDPRTGERLTDAQQLAHSLLAPNPDPGAPSREEVWCAPTVPIRYRYCKTHSPRAPCWTRRLHLNDSFASAPACAGSGTCVATSCSRMQWTMPGLPTATPRWILTSQKRSGSRWVSRPSISTRPARR
jgi:hypothetical protein